MTLKNNEELALQYLAKCWTDIFTFANGFLPDLLVAKTPEFHKEIYKLILSEQNLVIAAPRGFAKSTVVSIVYPIWLGITAKKKNILIVSASEKLASEILRKIKTEFELNEKLKQTFGDLRTDKWSETHIILKSGVTIIARGAQAQIRGFHPDCLIADDIESDEEVESEEQRKKLKSWLLKACLNTLLPGSQFIMVGNIIHPLSLLNDLLSSDQGWTKRRFKAYVDSMQEPGYELWPVERSHEWLQKKKKEIGSWAFAAEYMNDPIFDETAPIKPEQIREWKELPPQLNLVIALDPAYDEDEKSDYKVAALVGMDQNANRYLIHYIRTHDSLGDYMDSVLNLWLQHKGQVTAIGIPNSGIEKQFFQSFIDKATSRKLYPPIVELSNSFITQSGTSVRAKKKRIIASLQPLFEAGKYFIHPTHLEAREELLTIGSSRWDDLVDSMAYAEQVITPSFMDQTKEDRIWKHEKRKVLVDYGLE